MPSSSEETSSACGRPRWFWQFSEQLQYCAAGPVAGVGLAGLAVAAATTATLAAWAAARRRSSEHRRWMWRCYLLLCSAVVLRVLGGLGTVLGPVGPWYDPLATWLCWLAPLAVFEIREWSWTGR